MLAHRFEAHGQVARGRGEILRIDDEERPLPPRAHVVPEAQGQSRQVVVLAACDPDARPPKVRAYDDFGPFFCLCGFFACGTFRRRLIFGTSSPSIWADAQSGPHLPL